MQTPAGGDASGDQLLLWPTTLTFPSLASTSKQKRVALIFLSGIRAQGVETQQQPQSSSREEPASLAPAPAKVDPSITPSGARMRGDMHAKYVKGRFAEYDAALPHRVFLSWDRAFPSYVVSVLPAKRRSARPLEPQAADIIASREFFGLSHADVVNPSSWRATKRRAGGGGKRKDRAAEWDAAYSPASVDDPRIRLGRHRVVQNVAGMRLSVLPYTKLRVLKDELNAVFREQHPELPADLTLSMVRTIKRKTLLMAQAADLELSSVALAYTYFEKLVLKGVVSKANRKLVGAVCLLLALKLNDRADKAKPLLAELEREQGVLPAEALKAEFPVFSHLRFHLMVPVRQYAEHLVRLLGALQDQGVSVAEYLGGRDLHEIFDTGAEGSAESKSSDSSSSSDEGAA